ncbi:hypothetical protein M0805_002050 [Coniferiporia weirii]|nr:hypothetical protein M0805_002050 [Coniferiporia weirii]
MASKFLCAIALAAVALLPSAFVNAQITSETTTEVVVTTAPDPLLSLDTAATGTLTAECWLSTTISDEPALLPIEPSVASDLNGVVCQVEYSHDGGTVGAAITITDAIADPSSSPSATSVSDVAAPSSSSRAIKVLMPALIGSLGGAFLLILATLYFLRLRTRRKIQSSRANRWMTRNSGSWAMKEQKPRGPNV